MFREFFFKQTPRFLFYFLLLSLPVQLGRHFWPNESFVLGIRIDYLSPTFYLTDVVIFLILLLWTAGILIRKESFPAGKTIAIFLFPLALLVSTILSKSNNGFYYFAKILEMSFLSLFIAHEINFKKNIPIILKTLSIGVLWQSALSIFQFIDQKSLGLWVFGERSFTSLTPGISLVDLDGRQLLRPYGTFPHPNLLAAFLALILPALLIYFLAEKKKNFFIFAVFLIGSLSLAITFSRTAWFVGFASVFLILIFYAFKIKKITQSFKFGIFLALICAIFAWPFFWQRITSFSSTDGHSIILRLKLTKSAFEMFFTFPVFGVGPGNFLPFLPNFFTFEETIRWLQPVHNIFLLVLSESGILGLASFLVLLLYPFLKLAKIIKSDFIARLLVIWFLMVFFLGSFDHYFLTLQEGQLIFWIFLGFSYSYLLSKKENKRLVLQ